jgi:hypothetical protein
MVGGIIDINLLFNTLNLDLTAIAVYAGGVSGGQTTGALIDSDSGPLAFSFQGLASGTYTFVVSGTVVSGPGLHTVPVSYLGLATAIAGSTVPEPSSWATMLSALMIFALVRRARRVLPRH